MAFIWSPRIACQFRIRKIGSVLLVGCYFDACGGFPEGWRVELWNHLIFSKEGPVKKAFIATWVSIRVRPTGWSPRQIYCICPVVMGICGPVVRMEDCWLETKQLYCTFSHLLTEKNGQECTDNAELIHIIKQFYYKWNMQTKRYTKIKTFILRILSWRIHSASIRKQETFLCYFTLISTLPKLARGLSGCARSSYRNNYWGASRLNQGGRLLIDFISLGCGFDHWRVVIWEWRTVAFWDRNQIPEQLQIPWYNRKQTRVEPTRKQSPWKSWIRR